MSASLRRRRSPQQNERITSAERATPGDSSPVAAPQQARAVPRPGATSSAEVAPRGHWPTGRAGLHWSLGRRAICGSGAPGQAPKEAWSSCAFPGILHSRRLPSTQPLHNSLCCWGGPVVSHVFLLSLIRALTALPTPAKICDVLGLVSFIPPLSLARVESNRKGRRARTSKGTGPERHRE